jgi:phosphatidylinositol 4-phosphatase
MGRLKGHMIYKVIATEFLPLRERPLHDQDEDTYLALLKALIKSGPMYFSYSFDLTNTFQRQSQLDPSVPLWKRADDRFFWNRFVQSDLIDFRISGTRHQQGQQTGVDPYILPVMYGMMEIITTRFKSTPLTLVLITRRSRYRAGTRYFSRGIDEDGHVSNFNETEQIIILNDSTSGLGGFAGGGGMQNGKVGGSGGKEVQIMSYVQTRGSVPVFWAEVNTLHYTPKLQIRGVETAVSAAQAHFAEQIRLYGDNYLVNLVKQKGREQRVKEAYEQMIKMLVTSPYEGTSEDSRSNEKFHLVEPGSRQQQFDRLHYVYFDFHNETKGMQWHRVQFLIDQLHDALEKQQYFRGVDMPADLEGRLEVRNHQTSVVRTNCMDCLDRTNVVQSALARAAINRQLTDLGVLSRGETFSSDPAFEILFRKIWADNADVVSTSYSGTGALKTDFTRTGVRTKAGALQDLRNSIMRYAKNNFADGPKQDAFDLFLGAYLPTTSSYLVFVDQRPLLIQSIPYILAFSLFFVVIGSFTRRLPDAAVLPVRIFILFWFAVAAWCANFIIRNGMLYVSDFTTFFCKSLMTTGQLAKAESETVGY